MSQTGQKGSFSEAIQKGMEIPCPKCTTPMPMAASGCSNCKAEFKPEEVRQNIASKKNDPSGCIAISLVGILLIAVMIYVANLPDRAGSSSSADGTPSAGDVYVWKEAAKEVVRERLRDPDSAVFSGLEVLPGDEQTATIICGRVNSRNGFGGMTGPQRFIAGGTVMLEEDFTPAQIETAWTRFCM